MASTNKSSKRNGRHFQSTPDLIFDTLQGEIRRGVLAPGSALRQAALAERFEVSRIPVREALLRLESEDLIVVQPNRGAFVIQQTRSEVAEIYDLRIMLECDALSRATSRMGPEDIKVITRALQVAQDGADADGWNESDGAFHMALYAPSGRPHQLKIINTLRGTVERYWSAYSSLTGSTGDWLDDHQQIVNACALGDAKTAVAILRDHLQRAASVVLEQIPDE